jgi:hypothetical protein
MVTINAQQLTHGWAVTVSCLSGDDRPTVFFPPGGPPGQMPNGAELRELDTGKTYRFDADSAAWLLQPAASGGGSPRCDQISTFDWANVQLGWGFDDVYPAA